MSNPIENTIVYAVMNAEPSVIIHVHGRRVEVELPEPQKAGTETQKMSYARQVAYKILDAIRRDTESSSMNYYDVLRKSC